MTVMTMAAKAAVGEVLAAKVSLTILVTMTILTVTAIPVATTIQVGMMMIDRCPTRVSA